MSDYEVRELHEWHHPLRWAVHKGFKLVATFKTDAEAYKFMNERIERPGLYCRVCCTKLMVKNVCTVFCPNKKCGEQNEKEI